MLSKLQKAIQLETHPVAVLWSDQFPSDAITPGKGHPDNCVVNLASRAAYDGEIAAGPIRGTVPVMGRGTSGDWCRKHPHDVGTILLSRLVGWRGQLGKRPVMGVRPSSVLFWCLAPLSWAAYFK